MTIKVFTLEKYKELHARRKKLLDEMLTLNLEMLSLKRKIHGVNERISKHKLYLKEWDDEL